MAPAPLPLLVAAFSLLFAVATPIRDVTDACSSQVQGIYNSSFLPRLNFLDSVLVPLVVNCLCNWIKDNCLADLLKTVLVDDDLT